MSDVLGSPTRQPNPMSDNEPGVLVRNFFAVMNSSGENAQAAYEARLAELREHAEEVVPELERAERAADPGDYPTRWAIVHTATELRHPAALPFLRGLLQTPIPPEQSSDPHSFSTVAEETILRTTAVEGIGYLAAAENTLALETLFESLGLPSLSIRRAAVQAILATPDGQNLRERIAALLPENQRFLLDIKRIDVREVTQIAEPEQYLSSAARQAETELPPGLAGGESSPRSPGRNDPPQIR